MGLFKIKNQAGLYINTETICAVNVEMTPQGPKVVGRAEASGTNIFGAVTDPAQTADPMVHKIKKVLDNAGVRERRVSLTVPSESSMTRRFEMPILPKKEEKTAIRFEAQKFVPFDIKDLYFDYEVYPDTTRKKNSVVF